VLGGLESQGQVVRQLEDWKVLGVEVELQVLVGNLHGIVAMDETRPKVWSEKWRVVG